MGEEVDDILGRAVRVCDVDVVVEEFSTTILSMLGFGLMLLMDEVTNDKERKKNETDRRQTEKGK